MAVQGQLGMVYEGFRYRATLWCHRQHRIANHGGEDQEGGGWWEQFARW